MGGRDRDGCRPWEFLGPASETKALPAHPGVVTDAPAMEELLQGQARQAVWRIVELISLTGLPFEAHLRWSAGGASGMLAKVTVPVATRVCVYANSLEILAGNLSDQADNTVVTTVSRGYATTHNVYEQVFADSPGGGLDIPIPPFARSARVEPDTEANLGTVLIDVHDGFQTRRSQLNGLQQPDLGVALGNCAFLDVTSADPFRVCFHLAL